jgi:hypothetical protein
MHSTKGAIEAFSIGGIQLFIYDFCMAKSQHEQRRVRNFSSSPCGGDDLITASCSKGKIGSAGVGAQALPAVVDAVVCRWCCTDPFPWKRRVCPMNEALKFSLVILGIIAGLTATLVHAARYAKDVKLNGAAVATPNISGFQGAVFVVGVPDSTNDDYVVFGLSSEEKRDNPCYVTVRTENINDPSAKLDLKKDLCGGKEKSSQIEVAYDDRNYGGRAFVTGVRVCMNNDNTKVKGIQIRGKVINDSGGLVELENRAEGTSGIQHRIPAEPWDYRAHCNRNNWMRWAQCEDHHIATAVVLHFAAGKEPRSLTGVALQCRQVVENIPVIGAPNGGPL